MRTLIAVTTSATAVDDEINFNVSIASEGRNAYSSAARITPSSKVASVDGVDSLVIAKVGNEDTRHDDVSEAGACVLKDQLEVVHHLLGLLFDTAFNNGASVRVFGKLASDEEKVSGAHGMRVRRNGWKFPVGQINEFQHRADVNERV